MGQLDTEQARKVIEELQEDLIRVRVKSALLMSSNPVKEEKLRKIDKLLEEAQGIADALVPSDAGV